MSEISKAYEPQAVEAKWYQFWLDQKCFLADPASPKPAYSIVIPPPNVTGVLHMGHVLNNTLQDILARKARMEGKEVLWLPGTDHAGIATQVQVEKQLRKEEKKTRHDIGRDEFLRRVWAWKEKHGNIIIDQLKKLGASCDWSRERFTMDPAYLRCVQRVFVDLYQKGMIYRGKRMVNWCPVSLTALSDEEVIMKAQSGLLYYFKVEVVEEPGRFLTIATTRPETIPGDTAVAVNPNDPRYSSLIGKHVIRPLPGEMSREQRFIPIIGDAQVDFQFGTGVLKVTPAHDKTDFEIGQRHGLAVLEIMNPDATMNAAAGRDLEGLDRFKARKLAVERLREFGSLEKEEAYQNNIGFSERADVPIEPRLSEQWFLKYPSVRKARTCMEQEDDSRAPAPSPTPSTEASPGQKMRFYPQRWAKVYDHWMTHLQDWCISRQLWWGHEIPVFQKNAVKEDDALAFLQKAQQESSGEVVIRKDGDAMIVVTSIPGLQHALVQNGWVQDPDVLDTWFSSWLWPFATLGWPEQTETLQKFYPTTDLVTAPEIIFFWVARMIMAGFEYMGEMPFRNVYFTGIIRDKQGRKMSKSLGNSPDPLDLIAKYGADAVRFGTTRSAPLGQDVLFDEKDVELGRNFCNKLWNACRFRQMQGGETEGELRPELLSSDDKWILLKLHAAIFELTESLATYRFNEAAQVLYRFFWGEFCDWYLETTKAVFFGGDERLKASTVAVLDFVLSNTLRLFHPFLPFITEELWQGMGYHGDLPEDQGGRTIMFARWPKPFDLDFRDFYGLDDCYLESVTAKYELVTQGRNLRRERNIASSKKIKFVFRPINELIPHQREVLKILLNAESLEVDPNFEPKKGTPSVRSAAWGELYLPLDGLIDLTAERLRLTKELEKFREEVQKVEQKLANPAFTTKAPPAVLEEHKNRLAEWQSQRNQAETALRALEG